MSNDDKRPLGSILLKRNLLSPEALDAALRERERQQSRRPLASYLIERGLLDEHEALRALSEQLGVPGIDLSQVAILLKHLDVVPRDMAETHRILPVLVRGDRIFLAVADPTERRIIDELELITGKKVYPYVALRRTIEHTISEAYDARLRGETYHLAPHVPAETLRQLGLSPRPPQERTEKISSVPPEPPKGVVDQAGEERAARAKLDSGSFGELGRDVSKVSALPSEPRASSESRPPTPNTNIPGAGAVPSANGPLVLVVDDEEDIRKLLRRLLAGKGYRVLEADSGGLALRLVKKHVPDLIVLDAMLPELHGFEIARRLKGSAKYGRIAIVMISAVYRGWRIAEDLKDNYGIEEYLEKPFRIADVTAAITRALAAKGGNGEATTTRDPESLSAEAETALDAGIAAYKQGELDAAVSHLKRGIAIDPLAYRLRYHLALLYGKKGLVHEGIQELERAVDLHPKHFPALKNLAVLYEKAGFKHRAVEMWERCVHAAPDAETRDSIKQHVMELL
jgi:CheY-like chemotaxis protein